MTSPAPTPDAGGAGRRLAQLADLPVTVLRGVGDAVARDLGELEITTVFDLVTHYPRRHVDGTRMVTVDRLTPGEKATVLATVRRVNAPPSRPGRGRRGPARVELDIVDAGGRMRVVFFNQAWRARQLPAGTAALFFGPVSTYRDALQMVNPTVEVLHGAADSTEPEEDPTTGRLYPVYPLTERSGLTSQRVGRLVAEALERAGTFADPLDDVAQEPRRLEGISLPLGPQILQRVVDLLLLSLRDHPF